MTAFAFHYAGVLLEKKGVVVSTPRGGQGAPGNGGVPSIVNTLMVLCYPFKLHFSSFSPFSDFINLIIV